MKKVLTIALSLVLAMSLMISASAYMTDSWIRPDWQGSGITVRFYLYVYQAEREMGDLCDEIEAETSFSTLNSDGNGYVVEERVRAWLVAYNPTFHRDTGLITKKLENGDLTQYLNSGAIWTFNAHEGYSEHFASTMARVTGYQETGKIEFFHDFVNY
ncbi:MAG: hypothetical protein PHY15_00295 [Eubacteriales bacterium]|nr:hypothetical protein [Eubacteriales bacterium]MDD4475548.1 hypothetical protein [Eubacteriales bacterium]